jgi:lipopolysaccharide/colanic/teichoic acid biosynthesis glycosyltransferase
MAVLAIAVKLSSPGPILFRQRRIGQDGQVFEMLKFRTGAAQVRSGAIILPVRNLGNTIDPVIRKRTRIVAAKRSSW